MKVSVCTLVSQSIHISKHPSPLNLNGSFFDFFLQLIPYLGDDSLHLPFEIDVLWFFVKHFLKFPFFNGILSIHYRRFKLEDFLTENMFEKI